MITQEKVKELFYYNPNMGQLIRKVRTANRTKVGDVAGSRSNSGYIQTCVDNKIYYNHRLIWLYVNGEFPPDEIDHINGDRADNRLVNLREVTCLENCRNTKIYSNNKSGVLGVYWYGQRNKWRAVIQGDKKQIHLGYFQDLEDAKAARAEADIKYGFHPNHGRD